MASQRYVPLYSRYLPALSVLPLMAAFAAAFAAPPKAHVAKTAAAAPTGKLRYNRDIRPILADNCFACHGADSAARKAGLRLDRWADASAAREGGSPAIVKGRPMDSEMIRRILARAGDPLQMPPASGHKALTPAQKQILVRWVQEGAEYEAHWSYLPPRRTALPTVKNAKWVRNPIDRFVLARLEQAGLTPAPEADRRTLARRLSLDLTGLPPEPADVERFVQDKSPDAYEKLVERYLASPRWGEHRGRYWLDAARYADTHGIHFDNYREVWSYRDWVIQAFNQNMPFDKFTIEQLAGDLLPEPTLEQRIATGFNRCNITTNEGGSIAEEVSVSYTRDRTETASQVFLGTTAACAVCHDHKFDPLSQKEFYSLAAFFNNTTQAAMDGNIKDTPPIVSVPMPKDRPRFAALKGELDGARKLANARKDAARPDFTKWLGSPDAKAVAASVPADGMRFHAPLSEGQGTSIAATLDGQTTALTASAAPGWDAGQVAPKAFQRKGGSVVEVAAAGDFENKDSFTCAAWVKLAPNTGGAIVARMDEKNEHRGWDMWVEGNKVGAHLINKWPSDAVKVVTREALPAGQWRHVCITYDGGLKKESIRVYVDGVQKATDPQADALKGTIRTTVPLKIGQRHTTGGVDNTAIQDLRLYGRALAPDEVGRLARGTRAGYLVSRGDAQLTTGEKDELFGWWLTGQDAPYRELAAKVTALEGEEAAIRQRGTIAYVAQERKEEPMAYVLFRGEYDKRRDPVKPATPAFLPPMPAAYPKNRLGFARWLVRPEHPLTARVTVNRFWQELFGTGLVRTSEDFGVTGDQPSHPELLDWLAVEFREKNWDVKRFYRMMVTSATYRQAALVTPDKKRRDPQNRLLSRGPRFRMDAEMVRDYALATSGLLVGKMGGPSVRPYQPDGIWEAVAMPGSNTRNYQRDKGEGLYRRSLYTFWKRAAPPASMDIFNAPNRETCTVRRERTNTPLQALATMNDIQFVEAARFMAQRAVKEGGAVPAARLDWVARRLLARPLLPQEETVLKTILADLERYYRANPEDAKQLVAVGETKVDAAIRPEPLAAWTMLVNQMMNLDEVLNK
jgi:cytochrome c553